MFTGADTWLSRVLADDSLTRRTGRRARGFNPCLENERVENGVCAPCTGGGTRAAGDDPALGVDTGCDVSRPRRAEGRGGQLPRRRSHRRGVLQPRRGLRRRGDCRDAGLGRVAGDEHERAVLQQRILQRGYIAMGHLERHDHVPDVPRCRRVQPRYRYMGSPRASRPCRMFYQAYAFNQHLSRWDVSSVTTMQDMFYDANAFNTMPEGWDTSKVTDSIDILFCRRMVCEVHGRRRHTLPDRGWTRKDNACDASFRPSTAPSATAPTPS